MRTILLGLGLAGLAVWAGKRSGVNIREKLSDLVAGPGDRTNQGRLASDRQGSGADRGQAGGWGSAPSAASGGNDFAGASASTASGLDASDSFRAGIADENTIPTRVPAV